MSKLGTVVTLQRVYHAFPALSPFLQLFLSPSLLPLFFLSSFFSFYLPLSLARAREETASSRAEMVARAMVSVQNRRRRRRRRRR